MTNNIYYTTDPISKTNKMADQNKYLSYSAILVLASNTMNGPGITTLPDVAADAGLCLYVFLISLSVAMVAFVCRRMVYAMWSSLDEGLVGDAERQHGAEGSEDYESMKIVEEGVVRSLSIDKSDGEEEEQVGETGELIPDSAAQEESRLIHREHAEDGDEHHTEVESLLSHKDHEQNISTIARSHNRKQPSLERTSIVGQSREAYGRKASVYVAFTMVASALCLALAQMMLCAAILDGMFVAVGGKSCALGWPSSSADGDATSSSWIHCTTHASMKPFAGSGAPVSLISIGWIIAASASVAMGTVDLDEMMSVQFALFGCLVISASRFCWVLMRMANGLDEMTYDDDADFTKERMLGEDEDVNAVKWLVGAKPFQTVGPIMFNFAFVVTSPPSVAMAKKESTAYKSLGMSCAVMGIIYTLVGLCGASVSIAVKRGGDDSNLLSLILLSGGDDGPSTLDLGIIGLFGLSTVASVPVYCLLAKETLINDAGVAPFPSFLLSNVVPWILVALTYNAAFFEAFVNWSGLLILGYSNFSLPLLLDMALKKVRAATLVHKMHDDGKIIAITKGVFILVTASITMVIVMSISNSLTLAAVAFLFSVGIMVSSDNARQLCFYSFMCTLHSTQLPFRPICEYNCITVG